MCVLQIWMLCHLTYVTNNLWKNSTRIYIEFYKNTVQCTVYIDIYSILFYDCLKTNIVIFGIDSWILVIVH